MFRNPQKSIYKRDRYFAPPIQKSWNKGQVERKFRHPKNADLKENDYIELSKSPCAYDDEGTSTIPVERELKSSDLNRMDSVDFGHHQKSKNISLEESNLDERKSYLHERTHTDTHDIKSWIKYIDLQVCYLF